MVKMITMLWRSHFFEALTFKLGAYILLLSNIAIPHGLHRKWLHVRGWWLFPCSFALALLGMVMRLEGQVNAFDRLLMLPFSILFTFDAWLIAVTPAPFESRKK